MPNTWIVYIIKCSDNSLYTGITIDLSRRIEEHTNNIGAKYTKGKAPFQIIHTESFSNRSEATKRELEVKKMKRIAKLELATQSLNTQQT